MRYKVTALQAGRLQEMELDAGSEDELRERLAAQGAKLVSAQAQAKFSFGKKNVFGLSLFTQELIALLEAGLTLVEAIETLREKSGQDGNSVVLTRLIEGLYQGLTLSRVLGQMPEHFPPLYIATVGSAEKTGHLAEALKRYHHYESRLASVKKKIWSALVYPMVIITIGGGIMLFLLFYVIPKFSQIYASMKNLPPAAEMMLWWGELVHANGQFLFAAIIGAIAVTVMLLRTQAVKSSLAEWFWRLPKMETYRTLFSLTRFYRTVGLLLAGGLSIVAAMELAAQLLPSTMRLALAQAIVDIKSGQGVSSTLPRYGLTTPVAERLLRVGEQSGELATMCERSAQFCDEELDRAIDMFTRLFEPVLMLFIGVLIGGIVFLLYMPIFELAGSMQ
ncbi:general secretion pathway protein F [Andreprevotia lacus DSM 23236]|jgi:general secretion pathway protein F|uniref:General secretion pathway protein F n=1 Tax=Andreprevotia lacus DSM 23236 TaxID=1121001 RepID=A0A1W1WY99_9NEIS|nr:type II secretion system F family protein [Andreprevotia lacus]SMC16573.1 general secretion pathway protein F [Andreprevotia lacus DSM 23236]